MTRPEQMVLHFPILVHQEEVDGRPVWFARSVMTSDLGFGYTEDSAVAELTRVLEISMRIGVSKGLGPTEWLESQVPDEPRWIELWISLWNPPNGVVRRLSGAGYNVEVRIARRGAA